MQKKEKNIVKPDCVQNPFIRRNRVVIMLNDKEHNTLSRYLDKYKVKNKSKFVREALMQTVLKRLEEDYPSLFD
ncbi:MAG: hypothetical protein MJ010_05375 [Paludibacteraceae bacterium]|nr:hypothetical protein [Paludibacteraceae bacterium]